MCPSQMLDTQKRVSLRGSSVNCQREIERDLPMERSSTFLSGGTTHAICVDEQAKE
jgi:hypothetical protein